MFDPNSPAGPERSPSKEAERSARKKLAALTTTYFVRSHADAYVTRFLEGYWTNEEFHEPPCDIASLYLDQIHRMDISQRLSMAYGFPIVGSIGEALTLGTGKLAVDGVLLIAEHGDYPINVKGQKLYPRFEFMEQVIEVFRHSGRSVPVFVDKHLSYSWIQAKQMYDWSRELGFPLMAGSSAPCAFRRPPLDFPLDSPLKEVLAVGGGSPGDGWLFHTLEALQCFAERRPGGETGIRAVQAQRGPTVWKAAEEGRWDRTLLDAALECRFVEGTPGRPEEVSRQPLACFLEYNDGFRATALAMDGGLTFDYLVAVRLENHPEPFATLCHLPADHSGHISALMDAVGRMFLTGQTPYPIERTLLTSGALSYLMESGYRGQKRLETPMLDVCYRGPETSYYAPGPGI